MQKLLTPLSWVYGTIVKLRNHAYNRGWLRSQRGKLPTVVIGNVHLGGTGKTPHTLWLARELAAYKPGILSRGYGRKTRGFLWVNNDAKASDVGDEPLLYKFNSPDIPVAVCEDRITGIEKMAVSDRCKLVLLDDAFQHRKLHGDLNIALVRFDSLPADESYLPAGRLRDHRSRMQDANAVILTGLNDFDQLLPELSDLRKKLCVGENTRIFRSRLVYAPLFASGRKAEKEIKNIVLVTAIANAAPLKQHLSQTLEVVEHFNYRDHQHFDSSKLNDWRSALERHHADALVTTTKDLMRMKHLPGIDRLPVYTQPIDVQPENGDELIRWIIRSLKNTRPNEIVER